jgi:effector-binding domain-containing protein
MIETPSIVHTEPRHYAAVRRTVPLHEIGKIMGPSVQAVQAALEAQGRKPTGPWFTHHFVRPMEFFDLEICFPVDAPIETAGEVYSAVWPATTVARTVFHGNYNGLPKAWGELEAWMVASERPLGSEFWEVYAVNPQSEPDPANWRTELNWPVAG